MKMRQSDIFNEYAKLAEEQGLLSKESSIKKKAAENDWDYGTFTDAEILYGIKPDNEDDEQTLAQKAHPNTFSVGPAYDPMNAVVEDLYQRQSIMTYIALKNPNGFTSQRRYVAASNELMSSLVSTGFQMDSIDEVELMKLADSCVGLLEKKAFVPLLVYPAIALIGAIGALSYGSTSIQNVFANSQKVVERATELSGKPYASSIITSVSKLQQIAGDFASKKDSIITNNLDDVVTQSETNDAKAMVALIDEYKKQQLFVLAQIPKWISSIDLSLQEGTDSSNDTMEKITDFFSSVTPDAWQAQFSDTAKARELKDDIEALAGAIGESQKTLLQVQQIATKYYEPIQRKVEEKAAAAAAAEEAPIEEFDPAAEFPNFPLS